MDLISVIVPYYKKKEYIKKTIDSVINQSYKKIEVIIIYDDEDITELNFIKNFVKKDKRIKLIINKKNLGVGETRNKGIKIAKGKYISFIDADDIWKKNKLKIQINFMKKKGIKFSHTSYDVIDINDRIIGSRKAKSYDNFLNLSRSCDIGLSTVILKKEIFFKDLKFPKIKTKEDFVLWLKILKKGIKIFSLDKNLVKWRKSKNSLSSSTFQKLKDGFKVYNCFFKFNTFKSIFYLMILSLNSLKKTLINK